MHLRRALACFIVAAAFIAAACSAVAAPITIAFTGSVTDDPFGVGLATFEGTYTFDSESTDGAADPNTGSYTSVGPAFGITATFDGGAATAAVTGMLNIGIANDFGTVDQYTVTGLSATGEVGLFFEDPTASVFSSDALVVPPPPIDAFVFLQFRWFDTDVEILGTIATLTCIENCGPASVPEPGTALLAWLALLILCSQRNGLAPAFRGALARRTR